MPKAVYSNIDLRSKLIRNNINNFSVWYKPAFKYWSLEHWDQSLVASSGLRKTQEKQHAFNVYIISLMAWLLPRLLYNFCRGRSLHLGLKNRELLKYLKSVYLSLQCMFFFTLQIRRSIRPYFISHSTKKLFYDVITGLVTRLVMAYITFPFVLLELWPGIRLYLWVLFLLSV